MEGISHEACSLAGTLRLGKLIVFYDDNGISIDGKVEGWFTDDTPERFAAYGWHVCRASTAMDARGGRASAIRAARAETERPVAHLLQDRSSAGARRTKAGHQGSARRGAGRGGSGRGAQAARLDRIRRSSCRAEIRAAWDHRAAGRSRRGALAASCSRATRSAHPAAGARSSSGACAASCRRTGATPRKRRARRRAGGHRRRRRRAQSSQAALNVDRRRRCRSCSAARPTSPAPTTRCSKSSRAHHARRTLPATTSTTACASSA